jgi:HAD superfamily hydrolase (TIGR01509 family)
MADGSRLLPGGVIFDCDGVLVDSEPLSNAVLVDSFARHGFKVTLAELHERYIGGTIYTVAERARSDGAVLPESWVAETYAEIYAALRRGTPPIPGIHALLDSLDRARVPFAVASNGSIEKMRITLSQTGLWPRFEKRMLSAHVEGVAKPDPRLFLLAAEMLDQPPEACVVVEDSVTGCTAARAAAMRCLGFAPDGGGARLAAEGAFLVHSMEEVAQELGL